MNTIISNETNFENINTTKFSSFLKKFEVSKILGKSNFYKEKGVTVSKIFEYLFLLVFSGKNMFMDMKSSTEIKKDSVYRFLNSSRFNWRKFLLLLATSVIAYISKLTSDTREYVLTVDDSFYNRGRSKEVELLAKVFDHTDMKFKKGLRMLTVGWSDGNTFIPCVFSLLSSKEKKNRITEANPDIDKRSNGYKVREESKKKATDVVIDLLTQVKKFSIPAKYVLFDSWFSHCSVMLEIKTLGYDVIAMVKKTSKVFYSYYGKPMTLENIYASSIKRVIEGNILSSAIVAIGKDNEGSDVLAKLVFVKNKNKQSDWLAIISTDISILDEEVVRIYGKRWDIEVFFKTTKSFLKLAKEFQTRSYDSLVAHTTIVFARYIMLSYESRNTVDQRTGGELFMLFCDELEDIKFSDAMKLVLSLIKNLLSDSFALSKSKLDEFLSNFIASLPLSIRNRLMFLKCES